MRIPLTEPVFPRYIHINPITNQVHLIVPIFSGQEISTDNTYKAMTALKEFFDGGALRELKAYKDTLVFDIGLFEANNPKRARKAARLAQIEAYIEAIPAMQYQYSKAITALMKRPSNLYGIQLRSSKLDDQSKVVNLAFNVARSNDKQDGSPLSPLYRAMHHIFPSIVIAIRDPRANLIAAVLATLPASPSFEEVQSLLQKQSDSLFGLIIDFTKLTDGKPATKEVIDALMGFGSNEATPQEYINALLGACALNPWESIPTTPFYSISGDISVEDRTESLSILTQFFLANLNVYCQAKGISSQNFGVILDTAPELSEALVHVVSQALSVGADVEQALCDFCNTHRTEFILSHPLNEADVASVKRKFTQTWQAIATGEKSHMDDFMILDTEATGETSKFVTHQGSICVDFTEIVAPELPNQAYFRQVRDDFINHPVEIPDRNEFVADTLEIEPEVLLTRIDDTQLEKLPDDVQVSCRAHPGFQVRHFLHAVAKGKQQEAQALLNAIPTNIQELLRAKGIFTDYSGRTFNCTAYEYAYWAKDTHMCRMLECHMDKDTKTQILARITEMERIDPGTGQKIGLEYQQKGIIHHSAHFELTSLKQALREFIKNYGDWGTDRNESMIKAFWMQVGQEQRNLPAHLAQEYCRPGRSFDPTPQFNEETLPRVLTFYDWVTERNESWFPLTSSNSGLGFDFALIRAKLGLQAESDAMMQGWAAEIDLAAITKLDKVRTAELEKLRECLSSSAIGVLDVNPPNCRR